jgi:predicted RNase H-like nuclease (RuvC/YqgF family)
VSLQVVHVRDCISDSAGGEEREKDRSIKNTFSSDPGGEVHPKNGGSDERTVKEQSKTHREEQESNMERKVTKGRKKSTALSDPRDEIQGKIKENLRETKQITSRGKQIKRMPCRSWSSYSKDEHKKVNSTDQI